MSRRKLWEDHQCLQVDPCRLNNETLLSFDVGFPGTTHNEIRANEINKSTYTPFLTPSLSSVTNIYRGLFCPMIRRIVQGRANLPFPARWKPQRWLYLANTFLAPPPRGVVALVSVSDDKIQITILILRRGALSTPWFVVYCCLEHTPSCWPLMHFSAQPSYLNAKSSNLCKRNSEET